MFDEMIPLGSYEKTEKKRRPRNFSNLSNMIPGFLLKTYEILENSSYQSIVSWNDEGNAFIVKKVNEFGQEVLPKYFKHNNFASFVRQLNMYDFHKTRNDQNQNEFKHKLFIRGCKQISFNNHVKQRSLLKQIKRKSGESMSNPSASLQQGMMVRLSNQEKPFTQFNELVNEMAVLANKQSELEKLFKIIIKQNEKSQKENKYLWNELIKNKLNKFSNFQRQKTETQQERLLIWFLQTLAQPNKATVKKTNKVSNGFLMLKENDDISQQQSEQQQQEISNVFQKLLVGDNDSKEKQDSTLEGVSKKQLLQGLLQAFSFQRNNKRALKKLLMKQKYTDDDDSSQESDGESIFEENIYPPPPKKKIKQQQPLFMIPQKLNEEQNKNNQMMVYQEGGRKSFSQYPSVLTGDTKQSMQKLMLSPFKRDYFPFQIKDELSLNDNQSEFIRTDDQLLRRNSYSGQQCQDHNYMEYKLGEQ